MRKLFFLLLSVSLTTLVTGQIQFWNLNDIEEEPLILIRKQNKVKQVLVYQTGENWQVKDSNDIQEIRDYNMNGQLVAKTRFKYDWSAKQRNVLTVDSVFYSTDGKFLQYKNFEGPDYRQNYEYNAQYDKVTKAVSVNDYNFLNYAKELESYNVYSINAAKKVSSVKKYGKDKKISNTWLFTYDAAGRLIKEISKSADGLEGYTHKLSWSKTGQLEKYEELSGTTVGRTIYYEYDEIGRIVKKSTSSSYYKDFTDYHYSGSSKLIVATYLQYPGYTDKPNDRRHEYRVYVYKFY